MSSPPTLPQPAAATPATARMRTTTAAGRVFDRWLLLALLLSAAVVVPRSMLVAASHSNSWDDQYHLARGLLVLKGIRTSSILYNDPPLGECLNAIPLLLTGCQIHYTGPAGEQVVDKAVLFYQHLRPETLLVIVAAWKSLLFLPCAALVFHWARRLYGLAGAWLALGLVLFDPTIAAHVPIPALDVLAMEGILFACYFAWRYFEEPTAGRLVLAGVFAGAAPLLKHTAAIMPFVVAAFAAFWWVVVPITRRTPWPVWRSQLRPRLTALAGLVLIAAVSLWALTGFDYSRPDHVGRVFRADYTDPSFSFTRDVINDRMVRPEPAGIYWGSLAEGMNHGIDGHEAYLWGQKRYHGGFRYYFLAVAYYKVPIGFAAVMLLAVRGLRRVRFRRDEIGLLVPFLAWGVYVSFAGINTGFRHALPAYVFLLIWSGRAVVSASKPLRLATWAAFAVGALHGLSYHPDYLSYFNWPRDDNYRAIEDSNVDWGQTLVQVGDWLNTKAPKDVPISVCYYGDSLGDPVRYYLGDRVRKVEEHGPVPTEGLLVMTPMWEALRPDPWSVLYDRKPIAIIGHAMRVYDVSKLPHAPATQPAATR